MDRKERLRTLIANECIDYSFTKNHFEPGARRKHSGRWMFDFKKVILQPSSLSCIIDVLWDEIQHLDNFQIGGLESAAIPLVTALVIKAHQEGKIVNGFYVRKSRNKKNLHKHIEGTLSDGPIVLVDDLMNTSNSFQRQIEVLEKLKKHVVCVLTIVRFRDDDCYSSLKERGIRIVSPFTLKDFQLNLESRSLPKQNPHSRTLLFTPQVASYSIVSPKSTPLVNGDRIFFGTDEGYFYSLDRHDGTVIWKLAMGRHANLKSISSSPGLHNGIVFFGSYDGTFYAVDAQTGNIKWRFVECDWIGSSPAIAGELGLVFIGLEHGLPGRQGSLVALDIETGEKKWEHVSPALTHASPLYIPEHQEVCIGGNEGVLRMFDAVNGGLKWQFETEGGRTYLGDSGFSAGDIKSVPDYDTETDTIAFCSMDGCMYVVERSRGVLRYRVCTDYPQTSARAGIYSSPSFAQTSILFGALDKYVYCVDKHRGEILWKHITDGRIFASPAVVQEKVLIGSNDGRLYEFTLDTGECLSTTQFSERITNPIVYDAVTNAVYVVTHTDELYRLTLS